MPVPLRLLCATRSPSCEIARWALDFRGIPYEEAAGSGDVALEAAEGTVTGARAIVEYVEARSRRDARLLPDGRGAEVLALFDELLRLDEAALPARAQALLADGRPFLGGNELTIADVAFAARAPSSDHGRKVYEQRPKRAPLVPSPNKDTLRARLTAKLTSTAVLRRVIPLVRRWKPVLTLGKFAFASSHGTVVDVLRRDTDFTIKEVNAPRIDRLDGPFILGMDRGPDFERERTALEKILRETGLESVRTGAAARAAELIEAARPLGRIDVVGSYARPIAARTVADYFGMPGPDEPTLMRWMRTTFQDVFLNVANDKAVTAAAAASGKELREFENALIARLEAHPNGGQDVLSRLVRLKSEAPWLDRDGIRRNLGGMIVGAVDTTSKFVTLAIKELVDRPNALAEVAAAARANDMAAVRRYAYEAVRFDNHHSFLLRHAPRETTLGGKKIRAGSSVLVSVLGAMFDPAAFPDPNAFRGDREGYLHFGIGMHTCLGARINDVQIPELVAALARLPGLRRASGKTGQIVWDGPFPDRFVLAFDT